MTNIQCDVVLCQHNKDFHCMAIDVNIRLNHIMDSNGVDYTMIIECEQNTRK